MNTQTGEIMSEMERRFKDFPGSANYYKKTKLDTSPLQLARNPMPVGRNEPCLCGSGLKFKKCCLTGKPKLGATGDFPLGKMNNDDEGGLKLGVTHTKDPAMVILNFGTPVAWLGLTPKQARSLGLLLIKRAALCIECANVNEDDLSL